MLELLWMTLLIAAPSLLLIGLDVLIFGNGYYGIFGRSP
jgi:hypothetical protein